MGLQPKNGGRGGRGNKVCSRGGFGGKVGIEDEVKQKIEQNTDVVYWIFSLPSPLAFTGASSGDRKVQIDGKIQDFHHKVLSDFLLIHIHFKWKPMPAVCLEPRAWVVSECFYV